MQHCIPTAKRTLKNAYHQVYGATLKKAGINILKEKYESMVNADLGS